MFGFSLRKKIVPIEETDLVDATHSYLKRSFSKGPQCIVGTQLDIRHPGRNENAMRGHAASLSHQKDFASDFHFLMIETDANSL